MRWISNALSSADERITALHNCYTALMENGIFITFENFAPYTAEGTALSVLRWKAYQLANGRTGAQASAHVAQYKKDYFPITLSQHLTLLRECGFRVVEPLWLSYMQAGFLAIK